jgi:hypothetical protein
MSVRCVECSNFALRGSKLACNGFGHCALKRASEFVSGVRSRECGNFRQADGNAVAARMDWLDQRRKGNANRTE